MKQEIQLNNHNKKAMIAFHWITSEYYEFPNRYVWSVEKIIIPILIMANSTQLKSC